MPTPEARAARLVDALHENTEALRNVRRRYRWSIVLTALLALTLVFVVYTDHNTDVESCQDTNSIRREINDKFASIGDFLSEVDIEDPERQEFIELVRSNLPIRDCSEIGWIN